MQKPKWSWSEIGCWALIAIPVLVIGYLWLTSSPATNKIPDWMWLAFPAFMVLVYRLSAIETAIRETRSKLVDVEYLLKRHWNEH